MYLMGWVLLELPLLTSLMIVVTTSYKDVFLQDQALQDMYKKINNHIAYQSNNWLWVAYLSTHHVSIYWQ